MEFCITTPLDIDWLRVAAWYFIGMIGYLILMLIMNAKNSIQGVFTLKYMTPRLVLAAIVLYPLTILALIIYGED